MAPVVDLQSRIVKRQTLHTATQRVVIYHAKLVQTLVVHAHGQHEVAEQILRNVAPPRHLLARTQRIAHIVEEELPVVVAHVGRAHRCVEELHGLTFGRAHLGIEDREEIPLGEQRTPCLELVVDLAADGRVRNQMLRARDPKKSRRRGCCKRKKSIYLHLVQVFAGKYSKKNYFYPAKPASDEFQR